MIEPVALTTRLAVKVTEVPPLAVSLMVTVWPLEASPLKVPLWLAVAPRPGLFTANTEKSLVQLGPALTSKLNLAGNMSGAKLVPLTLPSVTLQSPVGAGPGLLFDPWLILDAALRLSCWCWYRGSFWVAAAA